MHHTVFVPHMIGVDLPEGDVIENVSEKCYKLI